MEYVAFVRKTGKQWEIEFPDCDGCVSVADTEEELEAFPAEALEGWLEAVLETGRSAPRPTERKRAPRGATLVRVPVRPGLAVAIALRWARTEKGLTQSDLAKRAGVSQPQIAKLENPDENPTIGTLAKVASALGARLDVVLSFER